MGIYGVIGVPEKENYLVDYTAGLQLEVGYFLFENLSLGGAVNRQWLPSRFSDVVFSELSLFTTYIITKKLPILPYLGLSTGASQRIVGGTGPSFIIPITDVSFFAMPSIGLEAGVNAKGLFMDISTGYKVYHFSEKFYEDLDYFFIKVGGKYKF